MSRKALLQISIIGPNAASIELPLKDGPNSTKGEVVPLRHFLRLGAVAMGTALAVWGQAVPGATSPSQPTPTTATHSATTPLVKPKPGHIKVVDPTNTFFRIMALVPLVGSGKHLDPIRPNYVPVHQPGNAYYSGIIAWTQVLTDDKKHAIVEMVARDPSAFKAVLADSGVVAFQQGKDSQAKMEAGFQQYKKGFTLASFPRAVAK